MENQEQNESNYLLQILQNNINKKVNLQYFNDLKNVIQASLNPNISQKEVRLYFKYYNLLTIVASKYISNNK